MSDEVYLKLRDFMDTLPGGYPTTDSGVEVRILEKLFTPEEAEMAMRLSSVPETAEAVVQRNGLEVNETARMLESMAGKGLLFRMRREGKVLYSAFQFIFGVYDFQVYSPQLGGATVPFEDRSVDPDGQLVAWSWDFGDGATSTEQHPTHTYAAPGSYEVSLTVTHDAGNTDTATMNYTVLRPPTADFEWSPVTPDEGQHTGTPGPSLKTA